MSVIAGSLVLTSCGDNKKEKDDASAPMQHEMHQESEDMAHAEETEKSVTEFKDEESQKLFDAYLAVKNALVQTDAEAAKSAAAELKSAAAGNEEIASVAQQMAETADVNKQRELFSELTKSMEPVLKGSISGGKIYKQYCPMAFEGKGDYWYSDSDQIRNPYFGDKMLKCGRVEDTIM
ncbi:DUF3347 domain-containing protein [Gramella sp. KN1008]|uniref:DUF3347 domain-containing protein n=1 Tax=Gramella sp. KN1008 TaxID=2529298 RepID=UPI0013F17BB1|nr:DUF3347 domain-containing protein [Gramella sp. KN1008]